MNALDGWHVVEAGEGIAVAYAGKLLADQGATVVKVEPVEGDRLRRWSAATPDEPARDIGALYEHLIFGKTVGAAQLGSADVVLAGPEAGGLLGSGWRASLRPDAVAIDIQPFGSDGPLAGQPATEFTLQAWSGLLSACGTADSPPLQMGAGPGAWAAGATAALAALAARRSRATEIEVSILEVMAVCLNNYPVLYRQFTGDVAAMSRGGDWPSVVRCKDGWIGLCIFTAQQWADFAAMIGRPDLEADERLNSMGGRSRNREFARSVIKPWLDEHTAAEIHELCGMFRVPAALIGNGRTVFEMEHIKSRGLLVDHPAGFSRPRPPITLTTRPAGPPGPTPAATRRPLQGITVVDLTAFWAGPYATHLLATLGANVLKVESPKRPDGMRTATVVRPPDPNWLEFGPTFHGANPAKRSVTIDFSVPAGRELVLDLVAGSDVVVENFTPRVLGNARLDFAHLTERRADVILLRMPGFGLDGPWRDHTGFAQTMEQTSGIGWLTGLPAGEPLVRSTIDPITGIHGAFAVLAALERRAHSGESQLIELPMLDVALNVAAEPILTWSAYGHLLERRGNRGLEAAPQGVYACLGSEQWVALSIVTDNHWDALVRLLGRPAWATGLSSRAERRAAHDRIDAELGAWFAGRDRDATVQLLLDAGVPAAPVWNQMLQDELPQLAERGFHQPLRHPLAGEVLYPGIGVRSHQLDLEYRAPAPMIGEHTGEVLREVLGLGDAALAQLADQGVISLRT
jgi:crotonobetainyl-CoA:carnitine CoA-transferase CaiB-like acyl-CoA transferase